MYNNNSFINNSFSNNNIQPGILKNSTTIITKKDLLRERSLNAAAAAAGKQTKIGLKAGLNPLKVLYGIYLLMKTTPTSLIRSKKTP